MEAIYNSSHQEYNSKDETDGDVWIGIGERGHVLLSELRIYFNQTMKKTNKDLYWWVLFFNARLERSVFGS